ncbi:hypothetical protein LOSG293_040460 [Secundilactobacillus oryzae JCM 18671]|uniref:Uncharacterized protein n=1 Tax=Secundilactobacillus oryzae JCM 18671 TaxID=1291743 RepID=A0A081BGY2_9LACO|nr:hypothetical protein [Secundilactobacillus oryzae]GAK47300.1 hypothetical protein LOSG293_040460 [Secundilactobacillus oryzae JCM 18671]
MTEKQLIQEILNTEAVLYEFEKSDESSSSYTLLIKRQNNDKRPLEVVNDEIKHYFDDASFGYQEELNPTGTPKPEDIRVTIKKN